MNNADLALLILRFAVGVVISIELGLACFAIFAPKAAAKTA